MQIAGWEHILRVARGIDESREPAADVALTLARLVLAFHREVVCHPVSGIPTKSVSLPAVSNGRVAAPSEKDAA